MRTSLLIGAGSCALALLAAPLAAQTRVGVVGGFVSSNIAASGPNGTFAPNARSRFAAGLSLQKQLTRHLTFGPEAMYIEKGDKETVSGVTGTFKLNYIEVPALLRLGAESGATRFFVLGGPSVAFRVSCSDQVNAGTGSLAGICDHTTQNNIRTTDFGAMFGAGIGINALSISARYDLGLTDIYHNATGNLSYHNHALLILAGVQLGW
jgi:Outer membrane protein beta-barrel domain